MSFSMEPLLDDAVIGSQAGWAMTFHKVEDGKIVDTPELIISREDYYSDISAKMPGGIEGGSYVFKIEGLTEKDHATIAKLDKSQNRIICVTRLYMYWYDRMSSYLDSIPVLSAASVLFGNSTEAPNPKTLVAELAVTRVSRKVGSRRYETHIEAREYIFDRIDSHCLDSSIYDNLKSSDIQTAAENISESLKINYKGHKLTGDVPKSVYEKSRRTLTVFKRLGGSIEQVSKKWGRGMLLIRDGVLHIGLRKIPFEGEKVKSLTYSNGFIEAEPLEKKKVDPICDDSETNKLQPPRQKYKIILKGRPDLKPGMVVEFEKPTLEQNYATNLGVIGDIASAVSNFSLFEDSGGDKVLLYVDGVQHNLARDKGFSTTLTGVQIEGTEENKVWDEYPSHHLKSKNKDKTDDGSGENRVAKAAGKIVLDAIENVRHAEIGEVRTSNSKTSGDVPGQTIDVWAGLAKSDGSRYQSHHLAFMRPSPLKIDDMPYASPFAWGKCGLVLPRYPGTRVLLNFRNGEVDDPVDIGTLWEAKKGPDSNPGDYWLILPTEVSENDRGAIDDDSEPSDYSGKATQDLIDAEGNRIIEVGELTVRVTKDKLNKAGDRPKRSAESNSVTIEHVDGQSSIVMKADGTVSITAKKLEIDTGSGEISLKTTGDISMSGTNINLKGTKVDVSS